MSAQRHSFAEQISSGLGESVAYIAANSSSFRLFLFGRLVLSTACTGSSGRIKFFFLAHMDTPFVVCGLPGTVLPLYTRVSSFQSSGSVFGRAYFRWYNSIVDRLTYQEAANLTPDALFGFFSSSPQGLSDERAAALREEFGPNESRRRSVTPLSVLVRQFRSAFVYLLLAASIIALFLGEYADAALIFMFLLINAGLGFYQEYRAERSLELLSRFIERTTRVRRNGTERIIPARDIVPGDILVLEAGDMIPADGRFLRVESVTVDESPLTGESVPVEKTAENLSGASDYASARNIGFARTTILSGEAELLVFATGDHSQVGDIARRIAEAESPSAFSEGIGKFSSFILKLILGTIPLVFLLNMLVHREAR